LRLLVVIPVHNEEKYVARVLERVRRFNPDILVVDDGSTDATPSILASCKDIHIVRHPRNMGYGRSLIDGFRYADEHGYDWVITMDCDEQHEPERIPDFVREIETDRWDLVSGSRYLAPHADDDMPPDDRRTINATITDIINSVFGLNITDAFCGFKAHRIAAMRRVPLDEPGYAFPMQLWPRVAVAGLRITEIPVRLIYKDRSRHFGGRLDDPSYRMQHYLSVLCAERDRLLVQMTPEWAASNIDEGL